MCAIHGAGMNAKDYDSRNEFGLWKPQAESWVEIDIRY